MKILTFFISLAVALLGGLWLLQGLGMVKLQPILCFANCDPIQGPSTTWAIIGAIVLASGSAAMVWSVKRN